jgi:hypothetical protein
MKLSTEVQVPPSPWKINYETRLMTIGSCFAEVVGNQLFESKFRVLPNLFGTVFNPYSIAKLVKMCSADTLPHVGHYVRSDGNLFFHYDFHSSVYSDVSVDDLDGKIRRNLIQTRQLLRNTDVLILTFGTAFVYRYLKTNELVTNCHKTPGKEFKKELLSLETLSGVMEELLGLVARLNPAARVILTVSPVRHTRDTLQLNQVSKAILRLLCHELEERYENVAYFPAYEIMLDELRDYRFYEPDLIHPDSVATDHIFRTFLKAYLDADTLETFKEWQQVVQMLKHKPRHGYSAEYRKHLAQIQERLRGLKSRLMIEKEIEEISLILKNNYP